MAGDPPSIRKQGELYERFQSAPAIDGGRSTFRSCSRSPSTVFQSAPAIDGGRSDSRGAAQAKDLSFQSAPAIDGGRSAPVWRCWARAGCFNPRPPSMAGDPELGGEVSLAVGVSIRARHRWRAILLAGGCGGATGDVSIRARHRWRAVLAMAVDVQPNRLVSIRARHRWRAIRADAWRGAAAGLFQSAPAIDGGGSAWTRCRRRRGGGFNPRPPSMAGDPARADVLNTAWRVSIRARHRWRAIPRWWGGCLRRAGFNPRPPSMAGDPHQSLTNSAMSPSFNPRPPSMAGDPSPGSSM